jgi:hypothetical protein
MRKYFNNGIHYIFQDFRTYLKEEKYKTKQNGGVQEGRNTIYSSLKNEISLFA